MWEIIRELVAAGVTIFLTTQYLDEADQLADRIAVLDHGRIVAEGTPDELKRRIPGGHVRLQFADPTCCARRPASSRRPLPTRSSSSSRCRPTARRLAPRAARRAGRGRIDVEQLSIHTPDLDDVFFAVTGSTSPRPRRPTRTPAPKGAVHDDHARLHRQRLAGHAAPQPQAPAALPVDDADAGRHADRVPAAVRLRLRRPARRRPRRARGTAAPTSTTSSPGSC